MKKKIAKFFSAQIKHGLYIQFFPGIVGLALALLHMHMPLMMPGRSIHALIALLGMPPGPRRRRSLAIPSPPAVQPGSGLD